MTKSRTDVDVIVVGAGAAGLAAAHKLSELNLRSAILEARRRIGGRIYTLQDDAIASPIELGAEFIHGRPDSLITAIRDAELDFHQTSGDAWSCEGAGLKRGNEVEEAWEEISRQMKRRRHNEQSFETFIQSADIDDRRKELATKYVEGFHAADPARVSLKSLVLEKEASDRVHGEKLFRLDGGYGALIRWYARTIGVQIHLGRCVRTISWGRGGVSAEYTADDSNERQTMSARAVIVTVPLPMLQGRDGVASIRFDPDLPAKRAAAQRLAMGNALRLVLAFSERVLDETLPSLGFLFCPESVFPTWWTTLPNQTNLITCWAGGPAADRLLGSGSDDLVSTALTALSKIVKTSKSRLERLLRRHYMHDWSRDPYSLGAYTYTPVHTLDARSELGEPVEATLFFAGEAVSTSGEHGTVHGAIKSGSLAAYQAAEVIGK
jgi:monoamine oxidase